MAEKLKQILSARGLPLSVHSPTNQQFVILENRQMEQLRKKVAFSFWEKLDETRTVVRFATGWSTSDSDLQALDDALFSLS